MIYYVDNKRHLVCLPYSVPNLHAMAKDLGIKRCWYHGGKRPHYDLPKRRIHELTAKCVQVSQRDIDWIIRTGKLYVSYKVTLKAVLTPNCSFRYQYVSDSTLEHRVSGG